MPNTLLNADMITREALRVLHQKLVFVGSINRAYDSSFAEEGAKIGSTLRIRNPNQFTVRNGAAISLQDVVETNTALTVDTQVGVDFEFSSKELTMNIDAFSDRYLRPAMSRIAAEIESKVLQQMYLATPNIVDGDGAAISLLRVLQGRKVLQDELAPEDDRTALLSTTHEVALVDALKGLFQDSEAIKKQYRDGMMGRTGGFDFYCSSHVARHTTGTAAKTTGYLSNSATAQVGSTIVIDGGTTTFRRGDIVTFAGVFAVHPQTKVSTGVLKTFVVTADTSTSATSLAISPAIVATGARQNVSNGIADNQAIVKVGAGNGETLDGSMVYHKDAFTFATADLVVPRGVDMASRQVYDGISMRMVRQYSISEDTFPVRFDVLYGAQAIRPEHACRIHADG
ncbi:MAG: P22 phage major capsid protein family protein [Leptolyngbyaceae bacterium]|nr:P22 phage major capsid protein family protein [Leptolyngbyaceae bacterium]